MHDAHRMVAIAVDPAVSGMSRLADMLQAEPFLPGRRALREQVAAARREEHTLAVILPSYRTDLAVFAHWLHADRVALYHPNPAEEGMPPVWRVALRAIFSVVDMTIAADDAALADAVRAGADPERITLPQDALPRLFEEPQRCSLSNGALEMGASLALDGAEAAGLVSLLEHLTSRRGVNVVNYHRVLPVEEARRYWRPQMAISEKVFEAQLEAFSVLRGFVSPEQIDRAEARGRVALTFDDGYEDNFRVALPILERFSAPACIYLVTQLIGQPRALWWDRVGFGLYVW